MKNKSKNKDVHRGIIRRLFPYFKPHGYLFILTFVFVLVKVGSEMFLLLTCKSVLSILENAAGTDAVDSVAHSWNQVFLTTLGLRSDLLNIADIWSVVAFMALGICTFIGGGYLRQLLPTIIIAHISFDMRRSLYDHLQRMDLHFFNNNRSGEIASRMTNDIVQGVQIFGRTITVILYQVILFTFVLVYMLNTNVILTLVALCLGIIFLINTRFFWGPLRRRSRDVQEKLGRINGEVSEKLSATKVTQSFTNEDHEMGLFSSIIHDLRVSAIRRGKLQNFHSILGQSIPKFGNCLLLTIGAFLILKGELTFAGLTFIWIMRDRLFTPFVMFTNLSEQMFTGIGSLDRVFEFFDFQSTVSDMPNARKLKSVDGRIQFDHVTFSYSPRNEASVLRNLNLEIEPGSSVAFIGKSGAGKTTAVDLISRFYDPDEGAILLDGVDIREFTLQSLREHIGVVLQDAILFSGTIKENVRYGNPEANTEKVQEALKMANAWDFVVEMKDGLQTEVGERGTTLSGGQKQRIAIARAFLKNPRILILDEATSALDTISEIQVQEAIERLMKNRTTIVIAHRLSTIRNVDKIAVFDDGAIVESGTHDELINKSVGFYRRYYAPQDDQSIDNEDATLLKRT